MATLSYSNQTCLSFIFFLLITMISSSQVSAQLSVNFYAATCPSVFNTIRTATQAAVAREPRMGASLLRLHFHDCFVNGCDGSVLLVDNGTFIGEQNQTGNRDSLRGFEVVDSIKTQVDAACGRNVVSCADILAVAARDSVVALGGQTYAIPVGRRDARTASQNVNDLPAFFEPLDVLLQKFSAKGFTPREMVALSGGHTIGQARCTTFRDHIYNQTANIDPPFRAARQANCPPTGGDNNLAPFDSPTPNGFDNSYFRELMGRRGLLQSDQALFNNGSTDTFVTTYSTNANVFATDFGLAMIKMGALSPLTGTQGEVRIDCKRVN